MKINLLQKVFAVMLVFSLSACTDLKEEILDGKEAIIAGGSADIQSVYRRLADFGEFTQVFGLSEMSSDELAGPTRGSDWDDNAALRQIHTHTWRTDHLWVKDTWNSLLTSIYTCDLVLNDASQSASHPEASFFKAFYYYLMIDLFGLVPYRDYNQGSNANALIYKSSEATEIAISMLESVVGSLPDKTNDNPALVSKDAGYFLLMKFYLNKVVFSSDTRQESYTNFAKADMDKCIEYFQKITASNINTDNTHRQGYTNPGYAYWKNFDIDNNTSPEIVFSVGSKRGDSSIGGFMQFYWRFGLHYNQTPSGWNGMSIPGDYYDKFEPNDYRINYVNPLLIQHFGNPVGILTGQMYEPGGTEKLYDRKENLLIFTEGFPLVITDANAIETAGYRPMKYIPDHEDLQMPENDQVLFRYSDAVLMAAEAILRGGNANGESAQDLLDEVRSRVGLGSVTATLDNIYDERGKELWFERWRRNDMIRFGTFLNSRKLKPYTSENKYLLYPIPASALTNPIFSKNQNEGY